MAKEEVESILSKFVLGLQVFLALWQVIKLTPVGAVIQGITGYLLTLVGAVIQGITGYLLRKGAYYRLRNCPGRVFKRVRCFKMLPTDEASTLDRDDNETTTTMVTHYLGVRYCLERRGNGVKRNQLFVNDSMTHYITEVNWYYLHCLVTCLSPQDPNTPEDRRRYPAVFLRNHKQFWDQVSTGGVMSFEEVLDCFIVEHSDFRPLHFYDLLLPVDLSVSEQKLLKVLNLAGLFLQTKEAFKVLSTVLSLTSAVLEFITPLREWIYGTINIVFCWAMHIICDKLPYSRRKQVYSLGNWVDNLKPSNDIQFRPVKGDHFRAVIGGGAKASCSSPYVLSEEDVPELSEDSTMTFNCGDHIKIKCQYAKFDDSAKISFFTTEDGEDWKQFGYQSLKCNNRHCDYLKICRFISGMNHCGSLKSYDPNNKDCCGLLKSYDLAGNKVRVRSLMESTICYVLNQCPPVYFVVLKRVENGDVE